MDEPSLKEVLIPEALTSLADLDAERSLSHAEKVAMRAAQQRWIDENIPKLAAAFENLPEDDKETVYALRNGRRSWRLDLPDWSKLARALLGPAPRGEEVRESARPNRKTVEFAEKFKGVNTHAIFRLWACW